VKFNNLYNGSFTRWAAFAGLGRSCIDLEDMLTHGLCRRSEYRPCWMDNAVDSPSLESRQGRGRPISIPTCDEQANLDHADAALAAAFGKLPGDDLHVTLIDGFRSSFMTAGRSASGDAALHTD
jgi:hypothetical protein